MELEGLGGQYGTRAAKAGVVEAGKLGQQQVRPYHCDSTASRLLSKVKHSWAWLVLLWGTRLESQVVYF